jgi:hypothetical protein
MRDLLGYVEVAAFCVLVSGVILGNLIILVG